MPAPRSTTTSPPGGTARRPARLRRRATTFLALLGAALVALTGLAAPATAHGGDIVISLGTDGQGGISANLTYKGDGHPVEESADLTVTAESEDGETVGPLTLMSASEGVGWYVSEPGVLSEGHWVLTATTTEPTKAEASAEVDVVPVKVPTPDPADDEAASDGSTDGGSGADGAGPDGVDAGTADGAGSSTTVWLVVGAVVVVGALAAIVLVRRRGRSAGTPAGR